ncbi:hypothetical protein [Photobacterium satsumensis]
MNLFGSVVDITFRVAQTGAAGIGLFIIMMTVAGAGIVTWLNKD